MSVQNLILSALRGAPRRLVRNMAGPPIEVDGFAMDANIQILANLAAKSAAAQDDATRAWRKFVRRETALTPSAAAPPPQCQDSRCRIAAGHGEAESADL